MVTCRQYNPPPGVKIGCARARPLFSGVSSSRLAVVTGAIGGLTVAAAGGDDTAVRQGFLSSGEVVLRRAGESYSTNPRSVSSGGRGVGAFFNAPAPSRMSHPTLRCGPR